jgi:Zn finger protein HypA/HybF involved in hydrogenase expression
MREINCFKCNQKVGEIRDASLMKNLKYICPSCHDDIIKKIQEDNIMDSLYSFVTKNDKYLKSKN